MLGKGKGVPSTRPLLTATVDESTRDNWREFARAQGVTVSALIEAIGRRLDQENTPDWQTAMVLLAREIDAHRRERGRLD